MAGQNLSHKILKPLLEHLVSIRLVEIEVNGRRKSFSTTEQGMRALRCYRNAIAMLTGGSSSCPLGGSFEESARLNPAFQLAD